MSKWLWSRPIQFLCIRSCSSCPQSMACRYACLCVCVCVCVWERERERVKWVSEWERYKRESLCECAKHINPRTSQHSSCSPTKRTLKSRFAWCVGVESLELASLLPFCASFISIWELCVGVLRCILIFRSCLSAYLSSQLQLIIKVYSEVFLILYSEVFLMQNSSQLAHCYPCSLFLSENRLTHVMYVQILSRHTCSHWRFSFPSFSIVFYW